MRRRFSGKDPDPGGSFRAAYGRALRRRTSLAAGLGRYRCTLQPRLRHRRGAAAVDLLSTPTAPESGAEEKLETAVAEAMA